MDSNASRLVRGFAAVLGGLDAAERADLLAGWAALEAGRSTPARVNAVLDHAAARRAQGAPEEPIDLLVRLRAIEPGDRAAVLERMRELAAGAPTRMVAADVAFLPGARLLRFHAADMPTSIGGHEVLEELGRGGMGVVYKVLEPRAGEVRALKCIQSDGRDDPLRVQRFEREIRLHSSLHHPGIVRIFGWGREGDVLYLVMEFVDGTPLGRVVDRGEVTVKRALEIARGIASALEHAHEKGVVHRDLKPANVLLDEDGRPRLLDFGLARDVASSSRLTASGDVVGTPRYAAPEQIDPGLGAIGPATDIHALGVLLFEMIALEPPYQADDVQGVFQRILIEPAPSPRRFCPNLTPSVEGLVLRCLEKDPAARYPDARALGADLDRCRAGERIWSRFGLELRRLARWTNRRRRAVASTAAFVVMAALGLLASRQAAEARRAIDEERELGAVEGTLRERQRWIEATSLVGAAENRLEAALAWRRTDRPEALPERADEIFGLLAEAERIDPGHPPALVLEAKLARLLGREDQARALLDRALARDPRSTAARWERATLRAERGDGAGALTDVARVRADDLDPGIASAARGLRALLSDDLDGAATELASAVEIDPLRTEAGRWLAEVARRRGDLARAEEALRFAVLADPGDPAGRRELARVLLERSAGDASRLEGAARESARALALAPAGSPEASRCRRVRLSSLRELARRRWLAGADWREPLAQAAEAAADEPALARLVERWRSGFDLLDADPGPLEALRDGLRAATGDHPEATRILAAGLAEFESLAPHVRDQALTDPALARLVARSRYALAARTGGAEGAQLLAQALALEPIDAASLREDLQFDLAPLAGRPEVDALLGR